MPASSEIAAQVFGTLGAICWSVQLLPQIWQNYKRHDTTGLQPSMMLLWASAGIPLGIYNITRSFPVALQVQPQILTVLSLITWGQTQVYSPGNRTKTWTAFVCGFLCIVAGAVEVGVVFGLNAATRGKSDDEVEYYWPVVLMGVMSAVLLCAGVGRHYIDIYKERTVRGISFLFVGIDALGDLTSLVSVVLWWKAGERLDVLGLVVYGSELAFWVGVFACGAWFNLRPWLTARLATRKSEWDSGQTARTDLAVEPDVMDGEVIQGENRKAGLVEGNEGRRNNLLLTAGMTLTPDVPAGGQSGLLRGRGSMSSSLASYASGTVFRTASIRSNSASVGNMDEQGDPQVRDVIRLRSVVQV